MTDSIRIGNCSGFFGDRQSAARELVESAEIDFLTGDWLAELTMLILQRQRSRDSSRGYASTFISQLEDVLGTCIERGIRIVSNAGGLNPAGCAKAVAALAERLGISASVAYVDGDDVLEQLPALAAAGMLTHLDTGDPVNIERGPLAANAYLGCWPIVACLDGGADVVVTGRVSDAALVIGPAASAFGWAKDDWDRLAGAVVAGHIIECGAQTTGGNYALFEEIPGLERLGFPIAEIRADGSSTITKADGSGGAVTVGTVTAQLLYEVGGAAYANPDVTARLDTVHLRQAARDRVEVSGTRGQPPPPTLKVSVALRGGYRNTAWLGLTGTKIDEKAAVAERAIWELVSGGRDAFDEVQVDVLGRPADDPDSLGSGTVLLRIAVRSEDERLAGRTFSSAVVQTGLSSYPGLFITAPPSAASSYEIFVPALIPAAAASGRAVVDGAQTILPSIGATPTPRVEQPLPDVDEKLTPAQSSEDDGLEVELRRVAAARSGDKGGDANVGIWTNDATTFDWLDRMLTLERFRDLIPDARSLEIRRYRFPNLNGINFVIRGFLGDGAASCLRVDNQAKGLGEYLLARHVHAPRRLVDSEVTRASPHLDR